MIEPTNGDNDKSCNGDIHALKINEGSAPSNTSQTVEDASRDIFYTTYKVIRFTNKWIIPSCSFYPAFQVLRSPTFSSDAKDPDKWYLSIRPNGTDQEESKDYMGLYLNLESTPKCMAFAKFKFSIINAAGEANNTFEAHRFYGFLPGKFRGQHNLILRSLLRSKDNGLLENDELKILCEVTVRKFYRFYNDVEKGPLRWPTDNLRDLINSDSMSDLTIFVAGDKFLAHKAILEASSVVFESMFPRNMEEDKDSVEIKDVTAAVMREMLAFIYTGESKKLNEMAIDLLDAADKYALERLKVMCGEAIARHICMENAVQILILADRHSAKELKKKVLDFIATHAEEIAETQDWKSLIKSCPRLIHDAYRALVCNFYY